MLIVIIGLLIIFIK